MASNVSWQDRKVKEGVEQIDQLLFHPNNPKIHPIRQTEAVKSAIREIGWMAKVKVNLRTSPEWGDEQGVEAVIDGHDRIKAAAQDGQDSVPVEYYDLSPNEERLFLLTYDPIGTMFARDREITEQLMQEVQSREVELMSFLEQELESLEISGTDDLGVAGNEKPNPRQLPIDVIYTLQGADATCCLAVRAGLKYGIQSRSYTLCPYSSSGQAGHEVVFIDNNYFNYDHDIHLKACKELRPKYCTVMDIMTPKQCKKDGVTYYSLEQIVDWAYELSEYAENVIVIPKYDCIDKIPEGFMLGYSVPTSHGGTPLHVDLFKGRRVHLLGGSWKKQLAYMSVLGDDVMSVDNNQVNNIARQFGNFIYPDGSSKQLQDVGLGHLTNARYAALALSFGAIGAAINEIYKG